MAIPLRADYAAGQLRSVAKTSKNSAQARRLLALAAIYEGASRTEAARIGAQIKSNNLGGDNVISVELH